METIDSTFGAALIGLIVGSCLYGITIIQTFAYFRSYNNDSKFVKSLVLILTYLITNFGNVDNLDKTTWYAFFISLQTDCNGLIGLIVEAFFARLSRNWFVTGIILILATLHFGLGVGEKIHAVLSERRITNTEYLPSASLHRTIWVTCLGLGAAAASDILIAGAMCYYLYKKRTGLKRINTGLTTSIIGTICVIAFGAMPTNFIWLGFFWIMGKCYVNSFLALLNSRDRLREKVTKAAVQLNNVGNGRSFQNSFTMSGTGAPKVSNYKMSLRDKLLAALADVPGTRTFHLHVLTSSPRKHNGLFPYAHPRPRAYLQDVFILLSEQTAPEAPRVLVTAIEASVYNIPATGCGVLYISKVDSSGHATAPSPTAALVRTFLTFYADPATRPITVQHLWIQLFARAQGQYLFPNSADFEGKRPLSDVKLCAWWTRIFSEVAAEVEGRLKGSGKVRLYYVLPGYPELEASHTLGRALSRALPADSPAAAVQWIYGHPYSQTEIPLPCPRSQNAEEPPHLGHFIPWFDDDPKSRFIDEIAHTTNSEGVRSPKRKRPRASTSSLHGEARPVKEREEDEEKPKDKDKDEHRRALGELAQVSPDEFWERMSFRQECVAGAVTGFFSMGISTPAAIDALGTDKEKASQPSPLAPQPGQLAPRLVRRIVATLMNHHEFSTRERAVRATETLEGAIKGLCGDDAPVIPAQAAAASTSPQDEPNRACTPEPGPATLEAPSTPPPGRSHLSASTAGGGVPEISPNPFPEPVASPETYTSYIYGSIEVRNPPLAPRNANGAESNGTGSGQGAAQGGTAGGGGGTPQVTVLQVRKKRKPAAP
ncbi:histone acetylation protein-domain-containing protein [Cubamyces menziesii]|nr:histone acetylation protein-domain-containing protein [Cubamyces menziesii]